jgi:hypothetical protein
MKCPHCSKNIDVRFIKAPDDSSPAKSSSEAVDATELGALLSSINEDSLDTESLAFYRKTQERFEQYGARTLMSDKQMKWLRKLAAGDAEDRW